MRLLFSVALDVSLTFARPLTVAFSESIDPPLSQETKDVYVKLKDTDIDSCQTVSEHLTRQILGELNFAVGAVKSFPSGRNSTCVSYHPNRCNML